MEFRKLVDKTYYFPDGALLELVARKIFGFGPSGQTVQKIKMTDITQKDIFGEENEAPGPAVIEVQGSASENSSTSENDDERRKGTAPSRKRLTILQKR